MIDFLSMKRALVVKALTDQILLVRTDSGDLLSLSLPCSCIRPGSMLTIDPSRAAETGCVVLSIDGHRCATGCSSPMVGMIIEHKDSKSDHLQLAGTGDKRNVI